MAIPFCSKQPDCLWLKTIRDVNKVLGEVADTSTVYWPWRWEPVWGHPNSSALLGRLQVPLKRACFSLLSGHLFSSQGKYFWKLGRLFCQVLLYLKHRSYRSIGIIQCHLAKDKIKCHCMFIFKKELTVWEFAILIVLFAQCFQPWFPKV